MTNDDTANVVAFPGCEVPRAYGEPNAALVTMLRDTLAMAERGELQSFIGTGFTGDKARFAFWAIPLNEDVYSMLGSIGWLEHEYVHRKTCDGRAMIPRTTTNIDEPA